MFKNKEGEEKILYYERLLGEFVFMIKNRREYENWYMSIWLAKWRRTKDGIF